MTYDEWERAFKADKIKPVYIIASQEYFFARQVVQKIKEALREQTEDDTNYQRLEGAETEFTELIEAVNTVPFFGSRRLVVLESADSFVSRLNKTEQEALRNYLGSPNPSTAFMMIFDTTDQKEWRDKHLKWTKEIKGTGDFLDCRKIYENQIPRWVKRIADRIGLKLNGKAMEYVCHYMGTDVQSIYSELNKLKVSAGKKPCLTLEDVQAVVGDRRQSDIFAFQHSLGEGDTGAALEMLSKLLAEGEEWPRVLSRMFYYFKQLLLIKELDERGQAKPGNITRITRNRNGRINQKFLLASRRFSRDELLGVFPRLLQADIDMKTGGPKAENVLPPLVAELCNRP